MTSYKMEKEVSANNTRLVPAVHVSDAHACTLTDSSVYAVWDKGWLVVGACRDAHHHQENM